MANMQVPNSKQIPVIKIQNAQRKSFQPFSFGYLELNWDFEFQTLRAKRSALSDQKRRKSSWLKK